MSQAEIHKNNGNNLFKQCRYQDAINEYSKAIHLDPKNATYYNNRATALLKLDRYQDAMRDGQKCVQLDPTYEKGAQKLVEASLKCGQLHQAQEVAQRLYNTNMSTKNRELLNDAQRAIKIQQTFNNDIDQALQNLVYIVCESINSLVQQEYPIFSSEERQKTIKSHDDFELGVCKIVEPLRQQRERLVEIGMKSIKDDYDFWQKTIPTQQLSSDLSCKYFLVMQMFVTIANKFTKFQLLGYQDDEQATNDPLYYQKQLQGYMSRASSIVKNLIQCCFYLQQEKYENAIPLLQKLVSQFPDIQHIAQGYNQYTQLKNNGSQQYKQRNHQEAFNSFMQATQVILPYQQLQSQQQQQISYGYSAILLSVLSLPAVTLSNASMAIQSTKPKNSVCLLLASTFLNDQYAKAHIRLAKFFQQMSMWGEAELQYSLASQIDKSDTQSQQAAQECQKQKNQYLRMNYYDLLNITDKNISTDSQEYQKVYKRMAAKWHPDRYSRDPVMKHFAEKKFREIQEANEVLTDKQKRAIYDQGGDPVHMGQAGMGSMNGVPIDISSMFGHHGGGMGMGMDIGDILGQMFGGMGRGNVHFSVNGQDFSNFNQGGRRQRQQQQSFGGMPFDLFSQFGQF